MSDLRQQFLNNPKPKKELFRPDFLDREIEIRSISLAERRDLVKNSRVQGDDGEEEQDDALFGANLMIATVFDPTSNARLFTVGDRDALTALDAAAMDPITEKALRINGLLAVSVTDAEKNSKPSPKSDSPTS
jgi:hypothetical protein